MLYDQELEVLDILVPRSRLPVPDAENVLRQLPAWLAHYKQVHPHRAVGSRSPREFIARSTPEGLAGN